jgi:hypothetical protein
VRFTSLYSFQYLLIPQTKPQTKIYVIMDTFMANLSPEVGVVLQENISNIIVISMLATAIYNAMEMVFITFDFVKNHRTLYFWSMQASCWGILVHAVTAIICYTSQQSTLPTSVFFIVGWYAMVTGQAVVCYFRLRLVVLDISKVRWVLWMIVVNACILHVPMTVLFFGRINGDPHFPRPAAIFNRIQLVGFCVQESVISCVYIPEAMRNLMCRQTSRPWATSSHHSSALHRRIRVSPQYSTPFDGVQAAFHTSQSTSCDIQYQIETGIRAALSSSHSNACRCSGFSTGPNARSVVIK